MSLEKEIKKEIKKRESNTINIYTTDMIVIEKILKGDMEDVSQIPIAIWKDAQNHLQASLEAEEEPRRFIQVTLKKTKDQSFNKLEAGEFFTLYATWLYYRRKEQIEKRGEEIKERSFFEYFFPVETKLKKIIKEDQSMINNLDYSSKNIKDKYKKNTLRGFIKLEIINIVKAD